MILKPSSSLRVFCGLALMSVAVLAQTRGPSQKELTGAIEDSQNWLYVDHDYHGTRFSGLDEISSTNVQRLGQACQHTFPEKEPSQTAPITYKGVVSATTAHYTIALDASNCRVLWQHKWQPKSREVVMTQRGAAIKDGKIVRGTADGFRLALDFATLKSFVADLNLFVYPCCGRAVPRRSVFGLDVRDSTRNEYRRDSTFHNPF